MTTVTVDLTKNPELAALVADKQPGDWIALKASVKARDDQTLTLRLEECDDCDKPKSDDDADGGDDDAEETPTAEPAAPAESAGTSLAKKLTAAANP